MRKLAKSAPWRRRHAADLTTKLKMNLWRIKLMKKFLLATVALVALGATVPALAADLAARPYAKAPAYSAAPIYNWTGCYIGGHLGVAFAGDRNFAGLTTTDDARFMGGVQGGADYQFAPNWVLGVEGQYSWLRGNFVTATFPGGAIYKKNKRGISSLH